MTNSDIEEDPELNDDLAEDNGNNNLQVVDSHDNNESEESSEDNKHHANQNPGKRSSNRNHQLAVIAEEESSDYDGSDELSDEVLRESVIQHSDDGQCCSITSPRSRLNARSLPGRSIESRDLSVPAQPAEGARRRSLPGRLVAEGDLIRYFHGYLSDDSEQWLLATVQLMYLTQQRLYPTYYNVLNELGTELSVELLPGERTWQILRGEDWEFVGDGERRPA